MEQKNQLAMFDHVLEHWRGFKPPSPHAYPFNSFKTNICCAEFLDIPDPKDVTMTLNRAIIDLVMHVLLSDLHADRGTVRNFLKFMMWGKELNCHLVNPRPSMRTTIHVCGNRLSLSSKAFTYSYLLFAITAGSPRLLTSPPHSPTDSSSRTR